PGALFIQAKIDLASGKSDEAIAAIRTAISAKPNWAEAYFVLGTALASKGDNTAARNELARALEIDANLFQAQQVLAKVHASLGEHQYAIEAGRRYLQQQPDSVEIRLLVAQCFVRLGKLRDLERLARPDPLIDNREVKSFALVPERSELTSRSKNGSFDGRKSVALCASGQRLADLLF
ncbi:tetratricopeptide repeat protein, partial [bacterium]|nr:tetratricopeptide repeat protein [bacterium]